MVPTSGAGFQLGVCYSSNGSCRSCAPCDFRLKQWLAVGGRGGSSSRAAVLQPPCPS